MLKLDKQTSTLILAIVTTAAGAYTSTKSTYASSDLSEIRERLARIEGSLGIPLATNR